MSRKLLWPVLVIGAALTVLPFAIGLPGKASAAGRSGVNTLLYRRAGGQGGAGADRRLRSQLNMKPAQVQQFLLGSFPATGKLLTALPAMVPIFSKVPAGLDHYKPLVDTMQANVSNYSKINSLPDFNLFTWFFAVPGVLLALIAATGLGAFRALHVPAHRHPHPAS